jgi:hypothetical protein
MDESTLSKYPNQPHFPLIAISQLFSVRIFSDAGQFSKIRLSDWVYQTPNQFVFDARGKKWAYSYNEPGIKKNFWTELTNPSISVAINWELQGNYSVEDLKQVLVDLAKKEDEVLTEYESSSFMQAIINQSQGFKDLCSILNKHVLRANEVELWKEQEQRA